jgi:hypothetical protein
MKPNAPREPSPAADALIAVILPKEKAPGIRAIGAMKPGEIYRVAPAEALRLVTVKRFEYATDEDRRQGIAFEAAQAAPTIDAAPAVVANPED